MAEGERLGEVSHFFDRISVAVLDLSGKTGLKVGDTVHFLGRHTDFQQKITSMQIEHEVVSEAEPGQEVAVEAKQRVRRGDSVFLLTTEE
jgi:translation elongation factor EF-1alpha